MRGYRVSMPRPVRTVRAGAALALALSVLLGTAACAGAPEAEPTASSPAEPRPEPSATASADPVVSEVLIDGDSVSVRRSDESTVVDVPFTSTAVDAVQKLSDALGETAETDVVDDDPCTPILDRSSFGGLHIWSSTEGIRKPAGAQFYVTVDEAETTGGTPIVIPSGQSVGDAADEVMAANLQSPSFDGGDWIDLHVDVVSGTADSDPSEYYGAYAQVKDDELAFVSSPTFYFYDC